MSESKDVYTAPVTSIVARLSLDIGELHAALRNMSATLDDIEEVMRKLKGDGAGDDTPTQTTAS